MKYGLQAGRVRYLKIQQISSTFALYYLIINFDLTTLFKLPII